MSAQEQFTAVFERHYDDVERFIRRRVSDLPVADLVAEVFLVAWRRWSAVPHERPLPWLYATARLVLANEIRGARRERRLAERLAGLRDQGVGLDHADDVSQRLAVAMAFDQLSEDDQETLRLRAWEHLDASSAAKVLGCSAASYRMRLSRARRRLRANLAKPAPTQVTTLDALLGVTATTDGVGGSR